MFDDEISGEIFDLRIRLGAKTLIKYLPNFPHQSKIGENVNCKNILNGVLEKLIILHTKYDYYSCIDAYLMFQAFIFMMQSYPYDCSLNEITDRIEHIKTKHVIIYPTFTFPAYEKILLLRSSPVYNLYVGSAPSTLTHNTLGGSCFHFFHDIAGHWDDFINYDMYIDKKTLTENYKKSNEDNMRLSSLYLNDPNDESLENNINRQFARIALFLYYHEIR